MFRSAGPSSVAFPPCAEINASRCSYTVEDSTPASRASGLRGPGVLGAPSEYRKAMRLPSEDQRGVSSGPWARVMIFTLRSLAVAIAICVCSLASVVTNATCVPSGDQAALGSSHTDPGQAVRRAAPDPSLALAIQSADTSASAPARLPVTTLP